MRRLAVLGVVCLFAMAAAAQETAPAAVDAVAEVVKTPIEPRAVTLPDDPDRMYSGNVDDSAGFRKMLSESILTQQAKDLGPARIQQCADAKQYVLANAAPSDPQPEAVLTKAAVLDACYKPNPSATAAVPMAPQEDSRPNVPEEQSPLQTASGVPLDLSQRAVLALTIIAVNTAKEAVINEGLSAFSTAICGNDDLRPYFNRTCSLVEVRTVMKKGKAIQLGTLTLKQIGNELQEAMRTDIDDALPTLIADLSIHLDASAQALLPFVAIAVDTLRTGDEANKGRVLARNILSNIRCQSGDANAMKRCAVVQLLATAAATSLDSGCAGDDNESCRQAFVNVVAAEALKRLQDWGLRENVTIPLPVAGQPFEVNTLLAALSPKNRTKLENSTAFKSLVLWNGRQFDSPQQLYRDLTTFVRQNRPSTPTFTGYITLLDKSVEFLATQPNTGIPATAFDAIRTALKRVNPRISRTIDLALLAFRAAQAFKRGSNIVTVTTETAMRTPCDPDRFDDIACGFRFTGVVLASIVSAEKKLKDPLDLTNEDDLETFVKLVVTDLRRTLAEPEQIGVEKWATERFLAYRADYSGFTEGLVRPIVTLETSVDRLRELEKILSPDENQRKARDAASQKVVSDGFDLVKTSLSLLPIDPAFRDRTVSVLGSVESGWVAIQKRDYSEVLNATLALASEVCIDAQAAPHISKIINTIAAYRPLLEALTASETKEEFTAAVDAFVDAAPTAMDLQELGRSAALSMYVGAGAGAAWLTKEEGSDERSAVANFAPYVPVGLEFAWNKTWGGMLSLVDVGAVAALYVRSGESDVPEARLSNVFSPGLVLRKSWIGKPYAMGLSASMVPDIDGSGSRAPRLSFFIAYQRPLLRLFPIAPNIVTQPSSSSPCD